MMGRILSGRLNPSTQTSQPNNFSKTFNSSLPDANGDALRIWCSETAEDQLGFLWLCDQLKTVAVTVTQVKVPLDSACAAPTPVYQQFTGLGEMDPQQVLTGQLPEITVTLAQRQAYSCAWQSLATENAALRVALNGRTTSVPTDFLDTWFLPYVHSELSVDEVLGQLLEGFPPGMPTWWLYSRLTNLRKP
ncbi:DUF3658 domain-containing protein [Levilactobacillus parabrevis]|nr:DUF3658 domain-containing protein [Levilactobacillus parabrevis]